MWRVVRIAVMWLLAAALPLQGATAAATPAACGPVRHAPHVEEMFPAEEMAPASGGHHEHAASHAVADSDADPSSTDHRCSACASCCTAAAMLARHAAVGSAGPADSYAPLAPCRVATFQNEGLERPPRPFLA